MSQEHLPQVAPEVEEAAEPDLELERARADMAELYIDLHKYGRTNEADEMLAARDRVPRTFYGDVGVRDDGTFVRFGASSASEANALTSPLQMPKSVLDDAHEKLRQYEEAKRNKVPFSRSGSDWQNLVIMGHVLSGGIPLVVKGVRKGIEHHKAVSASGVAEGLNDFADRYEEASIAIRKDDGEELTDAAIASLTRALESARDPDELWSTCLHEHANDFANLQERISDKKGELTRSEARAELTGVGIEEERLRLESELTVLRLSASNVVESVDQLADERANLWEEVAELDEAIDDASAAELARDAEIARVGQVKQAFDRLIDYSEDRHPNFMGKLRFRVFNEVLSSTNVGPDNLRVLERLNDYLKRADELVDNNASVKQMYEGVRNNFPELQLESWEHEQLHGDEDSQS